VQDYEETKFLLSKDSIKRFPPTPTNIIVSKEKGKKDDYIYMCWGKVNNRDEFLSLFDTCNSFVSEIDNLEVEKVNNSITLLAKEPMKSSIWKPRGLHHVNLLIDGLCKHRCLFEDYDSSFVAKKIDYERAEKILLRMVHGWETNFNQDSWKDVLGGHNDF